LGDELDLRPLIATCCDHGTLALSQACGTTLKPSKGDTTSECTGTASQFRLTMRFTKVQGSAPWLSASSAIRWCQLQRDTGDTSPAPQGGDRRSKRIEAEAARILWLVKETPDITLEEIKAELAEQGLGQRFLVSNHIRRRRRVCRTKYG
jgi:hypothetical protein